MSNDSLTGGSDKSKSQIGSHLGKDEQKSNFEFEDSTQLDPGIDKREFNITEHSPLLIDNKEIYYKGFLALSEEDKARVLLGMMMTIKNDPELYNLDSLGPVSYKERHQVNRDNLQFKLKFYGTIVLVGIIVLIIGIFTYMSLQKGVLDENGALTGIMNTLQEVLRIIFTDTPSSSY